MQDLANKQGADLKYFNDTDHHLWEFEISRDYAAGVYQLWKGGKCMYVGQTGNIFNRIGSHWGRDFDVIKFEHCTHQQDRLNLEDRRIKELKPEWNVREVKDGGLRDRRLKRGAPKGDKIAEAYQ